MKKQIFFFTILVVVISPNLSFSMLDEKKQRASRPIPIPRSSPIPHKFEYFKEGYELRSPDTIEEWKAYHKIRLTEIHNQYCSESVYDPEDPEEMSADNYSFIFVSYNSVDVFGTIRIDLLKQKKEAAFRWVAIAKEFQKTDLGRRMLELAEQFVREKKRNLIRIPAEEGSQKFYEKLGYQDKEWPAAPENSSNVRLAKILK